jgi:hypothetical protein
MGAKMLIGKSHDETANGDANLHNWIANRQNTVGDSMSVNKLPPNGIVYH